MDEAHYFLPDADALQLLDFTFNGYIVVTYCASRLPKELLAASEVGIVTCASDPSEVETLGMMCTCTGCDPETAPWCKRLGHLRPRQAVALPVTEEARGEPRLFTMANRLTPHVRHREKYVDVPVPENRAFVFVNGRPTGRASTLREFVSGLERSDPVALSTHIRRGDFSRWIREVFGDRALAADLEREEERYRMETDLNVVPEMVHTLRTRYDLADDR